MMIIMVQIIVLLCSVVFHELAHGVTALYYGDPTARNEGRLTVNPIKHADFLGSFVLPVLFIVMRAPFLLAWAKPVPVNPGYFRKPVRDMMLVAFAGPLTNFTIAVLFSLFLYLLPLQYFASEMQFWIVVTSFIAIQINVVLGLFNLFPIPPLDGSRILAYFVPDTVRNWLYRIEPYGILLIFVAVYLEVFHTVFKWGLPLIFSVLIPKDVLRLFDTSLSDGFSIVLKNGLCHVWG